MASPIRAVGTALLAAVAARVPAGRALAATWTLVPASSPGRFEGVAVAGDSAWAVGSSDAGPIATRWNGTSWTPTSVPGGGALHAVDAAEPAAVWAVGSAGSTTLAARWTGTAWTVAAGPAGALHGVKVLAADDVWAVGDNANRTLVTHWNGAAWTTVPSPNPDP